MRRRSMKARYQLTGANTVIATPGMHIQPITNIAVAANDPAVNDQFKRFGWFFALYSGSLTSFVALTSGVHYLLGLL